MQRFPLSDTCGFDARYDTCNIGCSENGTRRMHPPGVATPPKPLEEQEVMPMTKSTKSSRTDKPAKPHKFSPLFAHANGQWAKKVCRRLHDFGQWEHPDAALQKWLDQKDDLLGGRTPREKTDGELTVKILADTFLTATRRRVDSGELSAHTFRDYVVICQSIADKIGNHRAIVDIRPLDFANLWAAFAKVHGVYRLAKDVRVTRMLFKCRVGNDLIQHVVKFGSEFAEPDKKTKRKAKAAHGKKHFDADEVRRIIDAAPIQLKAMVLLGVNCGLGQSDCANFFKTHVDLETGWIDFPRPKTEVDRKCPCGRRPFNVRTFTSVTKSFYASLRSSCGSGAVRPLLWARSADAPPSCFPHGFDVAGKPEHAEQGRHTLHGGERLVSRCRTPTGQRPRQGDLSQAG